jgi:hypothetical protein
LKSAIPAIAVADGGCLMGTYYLLRSIQKTPTMPQHVAFADNSHLARNKTPKPRITKRVKDAIDAIVERGIAYNEAAAESGLTTSGAELAAVINDFRLHPYCATTPADPHHPGTGPKNSSFSRGSYRFRPSWAGIVGPENIWLGNVADCCGCG